MRRRIQVSLAGLVLLAGGARWLTPVERASAASSGPAFVAFESGPVRPLAMTPDRQRLVAANTPNGTLEVYRLASGTPVFESRVAVGLEPVAVAARSNDEIWVVNHLSDSVSVVSLAGTPRVIRTLLVGDEPRDIVFAGDPLRAFITTAHRGSNVRIRNWLRFPERAILNSLRRVFHGRMCGCSRPSGRLAMGAREGCRCAF
ncbi:MAG: hypothetical protein U0R19_34405 [Bryobacteraceae bacterium]